MSDFGDLMVELANHPDFGMKKAQPSAYERSMPAFMMGYDKNAGGPKMRSQMKEAEDISDAVPRGRGN